MGTYVKDALDLVEPGDRVTIRTAHGQELTGRAVIVTYNGALGYADLGQGVSHVALNMGGRHGTPGVATRENLVSVKKR